MDLQEKNECWHILNDICALERMYTLLRYNSFASFMHYYTYTVDFVSVKGRRYQKMHKLDVPMKGNYDGRDYSIAYCWLNNFREYLFTLIYQGMR